jgi:hypothetical protein
MKIKSLRWLTMMLPILFAACASPETPSAPAAPEAPAYKPYGNLLQVMRSIPFPHSNVIFDTQSRDPEKDKATSMSLSVYKVSDSDVYAGWPGVESSALAIAEAANVIMIPGRNCANGLPVPVEREDWKKFAQGLADAGMAAYAAAQTKDMDKMLEVSETVTNACSACHDIYRDVDQVGKMRCVAPN